MALVGLHLHLPLRLRLHPHQVEEVGRSALDGATVHLLDGTKSAVGVIVLVVDRVQHLHHQHLYHRHHHHRHQDQTSAVVGVNAAIVKPTTNKIHQPGVVHQKVSAALATESGARDSEQEFRVAWSCHGPGHLDRLACCIVGP